jgi:Xaa-Pro aminopeptidase
VQEALNLLDIQPGVVMAADDTMRADVLLLLQDMAKPRASIAAGSLMLSLRLQKSEIEVQALSLAAAQADEALLVGVEACRPGVTEREVADQIANYFRSHGAEVVDFTLVASGPNGAYPHHQFSDRILQMGDFVILDIGATLNGYHSDVTRMIHLGEPTEEERAIFDIVLEANKQGREAIQPGARACDIDHATRRVIEKAGYGPNFFHRTGHGIGLEVHETPWITPTNETILGPGMAFSVEPGIYLPGRLGVRIEDIVIVTKEGYHCLTGVDHELFVKG